MPLVPEDMLLSILPSTPATRISPDGLCPRLVDPKQVPRSLTETKLMIPVQLSETKQPPKIRRELLATSAPATEVMLTNVEPSRI